MVICATPGHGFEVAHAEGGVNVQAGELPGFNNVAQAVVGGVGFEVVLHGLVPLVVAHLLGNDGVDFDGDVGLQRYIGFTLSVIKKAPTRGFE
jgi:hypothetical protein